MKLWKDKLYYGGRDRYLHYVQLDANYSLVKLDPPHFSQINAILTLNDESILTASNDKNIRIWREDKDQGMITAAHSTSVTALTGSGDLVFSAGRGDMVKVWQGDTGLACVGAFTAPENVQCLSPSLDSSVLIGMDGGKLQLWTSSIQT